MALLFKNLLFTLIVPGTVAVYVPLMITWSLNPVSGFGLLVAVVVLTAGVTIYTWCVWDFATFGRGTPVPIDAPKKLVVRGLYRYTRNPMYVGVLTVIAGLSILFDSAVLLAYGLGVATCFHLFITIYEEPHLKSEFGQEYERYCARVGRWLPRLRRGD
jgi:protein-S-isoprenylcysteine O-methyltransferase Ste14